MANDRISNIITKAIDIMEREIDNLFNKNQLEKMDYDKLIEFTKTLVIIEKDNRIGAKEQTIETKTMTDEELEQAIIDEANKIKAKNG